MQVEEGRISGLKLLKPIVRPDSRGTFIKTFQASVFADAGLGTDFPEHYFSTSHRGVIRGLHFQTPPADHNKLVFCTAGEVFDVAVDLRADSSTYGQHQTFTLSAEDWSALYIPKGFAHGFAATSESATMAYFVSTEYSPENDTGPRYDSVGIEWPFDEPIVSDRDQQLPTFDSFTSPFTLES